MSLPCTDLETEDAYLSAVFTAAAQGNGNETLDRHPVPPACFASPQARAVHQAMREIHARDEEVSDGAVGRLLRERGVRFDEEWFLRLLRIPFIGTPRIAGRLQELREQRELREHALHLIRHCEEGDAAAIAATLRTLSDRPAAAGSEARVKSFRGLLEHTALQIIQNAEGSRNLFRLGTPTLDAAYELSPKAMLVLGAQTNVGKTSLAIAWALSMGQRGIPNGIISVEDPAEDWGAKAIGELARVNPARIWNHSLDARGHQRIMNSVAREAHHPISFSAVDDCTLDAVLDDMATMAKVHGAKVITVDYLQAILHRPGPTLRERIDNTLAELISQAGRLGVGLVLLCQLSRPPKGQEKREPTKHDLKESGTIENRAQCIVLLWREEDGPTAPIKGKVAKVKRGPGGQRFTLTRHRETGALVEQEDRWADEYQDAGDWR